MHHITFDSYSSVLFPTICSLTPPSSALSSSSTHCLPHPRTHTRHKMSATPTSELNATGQVFDGLFEQAWKHFGENKIHEAAILARRLLAQPRLSDTHRAGMHLLLADSEDCVRSVSLVFFVAQLNGLNFIAASMLPRRCGCMRVSQRTHLINKLLRSVA